MAALLDAAVESVRERTKIARFFRRNAQLRHGVPDDDETAPVVAIEHQHTHQHDGLDQGADAVKELAESVRNSGIKEGAEAIKEQTEAMKTAEQAKPIASPQATSPPVTPAEPKPSSWWQRWGKVATVAASIAVPIGGGMVAAVNHFTKPAEVVAPADGSLLQYLEDKGQHLPEPFKP
jgi:hypothetical protein